MALSTKPYKGARDFYPQDKRLQKYMFAKLRETAELYGYEEYDAPILEPLEIYLAKTGEEIVNEQTYVFEDRGGRKVVIRPEMTPTVSRMVAAKRQELAYPLRWYSIPNLWRYERPQRGRLREHWQLNVDIFGVADSSAELEIIQLVDSMFKSFKAKNNMYKIHINSRKLNDYVLASYLGLSDKEIQPLVKLIDRMHKMSKTEFISAADSILNQTSKSRGVTEKLMAFLGSTSIKELPEDVRSQECVKEIETLFSGLKDNGIDNTIYDPSLMRGFDYYTDIVFEVFDQHPDNNRSMLGGGRYDGLVGLFGVEPIPTVGFGWGDVTLANFLELHGLLPEFSPETAIYVALIGDVRQSAQQVIKELRRNGINVAVDLSAKRLGDQFKTAEKKGVNNVLVIGEDEVKKQSYILKDLAGGSQKDLQLDALVKEIKKL